MDAAIAAQLGTSEMNNWINRCDPPKDAGDTNHLSNTNKSHRNAMSRALDVAYPYLIPAQQNAPKYPGQPPFIGDTKPFLTGIINDNFGQGAMITNKQELTRLNISPNGANNRLFNDKIIAHDAGLGPSGLFGDNYQLIITPGSILDPATKIRLRGIDNGWYINPNPPGMQTLPANVLTRIGMRTSIPAGITFNYVAGDQNPYQFTIPIIQQGGDVQVAVNFDRNFVAQGDSAKYFAGNPTKNAFIQANAGNANEIIKYVVIKNIGDALQVIWLLYIILTNDAANKNRYAMMTCDKVVWMRCIANNMSIFLTSGNTAAYYGAMTAEAYTVMMKAKLAEDVNRTNTAVIEMMKNLLKELRNMASTATIQEQPIANFRNDKRGPFIYLIDTIATQLTAVHVIIQQTLGPAANGDTLEVYREKAARFTMHCPIGKKGSAYSIVRAFSAFLPKNITDNPYHRLPFDPTHIWAASRRALAVRALNNICGPLGAPDIPLGGNIPVYQAGGAYPGDYAAAIYDAPINPDPYNAENFQYMREILGAPGNFAKPGFKSNFIITYFPDVLQIGYACFIYSGAAHNPASYEYLLLSKDPLLEELTDSFISQDTAHSFTTAVPPATTATFTALDVAAVNLCKHAYQVIVYITDGIVSQYAKACAAMIVNQTDITTPATIVASDAVAVADIDAVIPRLNPLQILDIYGIYQTMYTNELTASHTNTRSTPGVVYHPYDDALAQIGVFNGVADNAEGDRTAFNDAIRAGVLAAVVVPAQAIPAGQFAGAGAPLVAVPQYAEVGPLSNYNSDKIGSDREEAFRIVMLVMFNDSRVLRKYRIKLQSFMMEKISKGVYNSLNNPAMNREIINAWREASKMGIENKKQKKELIKRYLITIIKKYASVKQVQYEREDEDEDEENTQMNPINQPGGARSTMRCKRNYRKSTYKSRSRKHIRRTRKAVAAARRRRTIRRSK